MALKYYNNLPTPHSLSSTEDSPSLPQSHLIPSNSQISNFKPIMAAERRGSRGVKRTRSFSEDSTDEEQDISWSVKRGNRGGVDTSQKGVRNALETGARMPVKRLLKRRRLDSPERLISSVSVQLLPPTQPSSYSDEDDYESDVPPSESSRGSSTIPKNPGSVSSPSEYSNINGLLRALHLNREWQSTKRRQDQLVETTRNTFNNTDDIHANVANQSQRIEIGDSEKNTVTQIYEGTNRALGRLMLSRHQPLQRMSDSDESEGSGSESASDEEL